MKKNRNTHYFDSMSSLMGYACKAAACLEDVFTHYNEKDPMEWVREVHAIEHAADLEKHTVVKRLSKEFLPPVALEDIMAVIETIDDVTDSIDEAVQFLYMYNVSEIHPGAKEFALLIRECCAAVKEALDQFANFKRSATLPGLLVQVNELEERGDRLLIENIRALYSDDSLNTRTITAWREIFNCLENCCDACEHVADTIEMTIMKNT